MQSPLSVAEALRFARDTRAVEIRAGLLEQVPRVFREQFGRQPAVIVADPNTFAAAGQRVQAAFQAAAHPGVESYLLRAPDLYAEHRFVEELEAVFRARPAIPIAVGSGTINDLTKLAAHRTGRPYLCVATAASMDGYTAFGASITYQGAKQTFFCPAPTAVVADLDVICAAPGLMNAWGYADLLAKVTAGADWIVADALEVEPVDGTAWAIVQGRLPEWVANPVGVAARDPHAVGQLVEGLMMGGFAMQQTQSSRPASGAEHQFSHLWDMQHHTHHGQTPSHGFKVGVGTVAVTALYEFLLEQPLEHLEVEAVVAAWPEANTWQRRAAAWLSDEPLRAVANRELAAKQPTPDELRRQLTLLRERWPDLRVRLRAQLLPLARLRAKLAAVGAPTEPEEIGISRARLRHSYRQAFCIRRRFTVLDLAARTGLLEAALEQIFGPQGLWPVTANEPADVRA